MNNKFSKVFLILGILTLFASCKKDYLDINKDPNNPTTARVDLLLPAAQVNMGYAIGWRLNYFTNALNQYWTNGPGVSLIDIERFSLRASDADIPWGAFYDRSLRDLKYLNDSGEPYYHGIGLLLSAYQYQVLVDMFGDVPYSNALKGQIDDGGITSPSYDKADDIYKSLIADVDRAISLLDTTGTSFTIPGSDDLIFGGDLDAWKRFANTLKLKMYLRLSEVDASFASAGIANLPSDPAEYLSGDGDFALLSFPGSSNNQNPLYADLQSGNGNFFVASKTFLNSMLFSNDERRFSYFNPPAAGGDLAGIAQGNVNNEGGSQTTYSRLSSNVYSSTTPVVFFSPYEVNLLLAEAVARSFMSGDDEDFFNQAVIQSFIELGLEEADADDYLNQEAKPYNTASVNTKLASIAKEKWTALAFKQSTEAWIETRKFDTPSNPVFRGGIFVTPPLSVLGTGVFPNRFLYPQTEISYNTSFPGQAAITGKVFWDN